MSSASSPEATQTQTVSDPALVGDMSALPKQTGYVYAGRAEIYFPGRTPSGHPEGGDDIYLLCLSEFASPRQVQTQYFHRIFIFLSQKICQVGTKNALFGWERFSLRALCTCYADVLHAVYFKGLLWVTTHCLCGTKCLVFFRARSVSSVRLLIMSQTLFVSWGVERSGGQLVSWGLSGFYVCMRVQSVNFQNRCCFMPDSFRHFLGSKLKQRQSQNCQLDAGMHTLALISFREHFMCN